MTFQSSAFQNSGFQTDDTPPDEGGAKPGGGFAWSGRPFATPDERYGRAPKARDVRVVLVPQDDGEKVFMSLLVDVDRAIARRNKAIAALLLASA